MSKELSKELSCFAQVQMDLPTSGLLWLRIRFSVYEMPGLLRPFLVPGVYLWFIYFVYLWLKIVIVTDYGENWSNVPNSSLYHHRASVIPHQDSPRFSFIYHRSLPQRALLTPTNHSCLSVWFGVGNRRERTGALKGDIFRTLLLSYRL